MYNIIIQTGYILHLSVLPVLKALDDSALAGHRKLPAAAIKIRKGTHHAHSDVRTQRRVTYNSLVCQFSQTFSVLTLLPSQLCHTE